jgi:hypothetical protein
MAVSVYGMCIYVSLNLSMKVVMKFLIDWHDALSKKKSVALVRQHTIPTERPLLVGEVTANFSGQRVSSGQRNESPRPLISIF